MTTRTGTVGAFDEHVGLGTVIDEEGASYRFHCTQIDDGSRTIPPGAAVEFHLAAVHGGCWEAVGIRRPRKV